MEDYYLYKLEADEKFNTFFRHCKMPKHPCLFILLTATTFALVTLRTNTWMLSAPGIFIMWNCWIGVVEKERIVDYCVLKEMAMQTEFIEEGIEADCIKNFPGDPMYVTNEDRDFIVEMEILRYWNMTMKEKIRRHYIELIQMTMVYVIAYLLVWYLSK